MVLQEAMESEEAASILQYVVIISATPEKAIGWFRDSGYMCYM
jgi:hypothetical protein